MSTLSQFTGSGFAIGSCMVGPDGDATLRLYSGSMWLRQGSFASAASYPYAATIENLKAIQLGSVLNPTVGTAIGDATADAAGNMIFGSFDGSSGNLTRSADNGATWAGQTPGVTGGISLCRLRHLNGKFFILANNTFDVYASYSTTGAPGSWTTQQAGTVGGGSLTATTADMDWTGTNYVIAVASASASTGTIYTSPDGVTYTQRAFPATPVGPVKIAASQTGGTVVVGYASTGDKYRVSTDHGVTFGAELVLPVTAFTSLWTVGNRFYVAGTFGSGIAVYSTTTPAVATSWARVALPFAAVLSSTQMGSAYIYRNVARDAAYLCTGVRAYLLRFDANGNCACRRTNRTSTHGSNTSGPCIVENGYTLTFTNLLNSQIGRVAADFTNFNAVSLGDDIETGPTVPRNTYVRIS